MTLDHRDVLGFIICEWRLLSSSRRSLNKVSSLKLDLTALEGIDPSVSSQRVIS